MRIYTYRPRGKPTGYYGCARATGRPVLLGRTDESFEPFVASGNFIAYQLLRVVRNTTSITLDVVNVRTRQLIHQWEASSLEPTHYWGVTSIALTRQGAVAWIAGYNTDADPRETFEVRKSDAAGSAVLLDTSGAIDPYSIAATSTHAYWTDGSTDRAAPLS